MNPQEARTKLVRMFLEHSNTLVACGLGDCTFGQMADQLLKLRRSRPSRTTMVRRKNKTKSK